MNHHVTGAVASPGAGRGASNLVRAGPFSSPPPGRDHPRAMRRWTAHGPPSQYRGDRNHGTILILILEEVILTLQEATPRV